ncbi:uncharacterized protein LOC122515076 isoform X2 [Polistes fuscatus]|uniref:uncharacterized protein LOC122515076 isoform X2 n=1 Tax=Polistes fuscatus TaxID=30207 RepID=UPI001CA879F4|nr:uncharacterized protein LOC122515076 isoform X2 [Polistes fuscatus]
MAVDNPSYFSLSVSTSSTGTTTTPSSICPSSSTNHTHRRHPGLTGLFRRRPTCKMGATSSTSVTSASTASTSTNHQESSSHRISGSSGSTPSTPTEERVPMLSRSVGNGATSGPFNQRRSFRNLFRSVSANDHERTQQFLKGDPRPSDVAPTYLPHRSHSHSENDRRRPARNRRVLKSASELLSNDMVYCGLSGDANDHDDDDDEDSAEEVFLGVDDAKYYNLSSTLPSPGSAASGQRRHSVGTFLGKDRNHCPGRRPTQTVEVLVEPSVMAPPIPTDAVDGIVHADDRRNRSNDCRFRRRRHRSSSSKGSRSATGLTKFDSSPEDDVVFVSSKESESSGLWVNYLTACFEQISRQQGRPPFKVRHVAVEESLAPGTEERIKGARLQIVVVCPILLERVTCRPEHAANLSKHLIIERVLAMMLGVQDGVVTDTHKSALVSYNQWRKFFVKDQDETFVGEFLGAAISILGTAPPSTLRNDKTVFSVHPKKVKIGQNRIIALLNDPLHPDDNVSVIVDRCGEGIDIPHVKRRNPYTLQFSIPERCLEVSMLVGVRISRNGCPLGVRQVKCESRLRELDQILRAHDNPLEFMCQTFGFHPGDREQLDNWMVHAFQRNVPPHFNLLSTPNDILPTPKNHTSPEENPTLLHFAARFGLERLAWQLLECPGGDLACDLRNVSELTPADLAEQAGHTRLAHQLRGYMQMNEFTNMYSYLKVISENASSQTTDNQSTNDKSNEKTNETNNDKTNETEGNDVNENKCENKNSNEKNNDRINDQEDYCRPRPLSEAYSVPPAARPITSLILPTQLMTPSNINSNNPLEANYSIVPAPTPVIISPTTPTFIPNGLDLPLQGYMKMHPAGPKTPTLNGTYQVPSRTATPTQNRLDSQSSYPGGREDSQCSVSCGRTSSNSSTRSKEHSRPQDELLEIINDFKNNVFTISEVERLVENWRNRNDVQQSFKDKQRQLTAMREEYERIQKKLKEEMKAPTPFDRIRKFFSKGKKDPKDSTNGTDDFSPTTKPETVNGTLADRRPVSSLSLGSVSSSSSSGRMSTVSGCSGTSLGDSGTHSDPEDKRIQNRGDKAGVMSYEIPPTPKPLGGTYSPALRYSPSPRSSTATDLDLRPSQLPSRAEDNEYYIAFPPSGLPVHSFKSDGLLREPMTPGSPNEHPKYLELNQNVSGKKLDGENTKQSNTHIDPSSINITSSVTPVPPPGMCIPSNYVNTMPVCILSSSNQTTRSHDALLNGLGRSTETNSSNSIEVEAIIEPVPSSNEDNVSVQQNKLHSGSENNEEYVQTDVNNEDSSKLHHEYMNLGMNSQDIVKIVGSIPKKWPAPPVPPRTVTKK